MQLFVLHGYKHAFILDPPVTYNGMKGKEVYGETGFLQIICTILKLFNGWKIQHDTNFPYLLKASRSALCDTST